ncbi:MAG: hypothetical protein ACE5DI_03625 [Candidatus Micrarchaeia archaeon]
MKKKSKRSSKKSLKKPVKRLKKKVVTARRSVGARSVSRGKVVKRKLVGKTSSKRVSKKSLRSRPSITELLRRSPEDWKKEGAVFEQEFSVGFENSDNESDFSGED